MEYKKHRKVSRPSSASPTLADPFPPQSSSRTFPLLSLPSELVEAIFELAYEDEKPTEPLCCALLRPYLSANHRRFRRTSHPDLRRLIQGLKKHKSVRRKVDTVELEFSDSAWGPVTISFEDSSAFLKRLPHLRRFRLFNAEPYLLEALISHIMSFGRHSIQSLEFAPCCPTHLSPADLVDLVQPLLSLSSLTLDLTEFPPDLFSTISGVLSTTVTYLRLDYPNEGITSLPLQHLFPSLVDLTLTAAYEEVALIDQLYEAPSTLESLTLRVERCDFDDGFIPDYILLDNILPRFTELEHLELCVDSFSPDPLLIYLQSLPSLSSLTFGPASPVTNELLLALVTPSTRPSFLTRLTLDYVSNDRGPTLKQKDGELADDADSTDGHVYPGWVEPQWNDECDAYGLWRVLEEARKSGITVKGTALGAERWEQDFEAEKQECTMAWCHRSDSFGEAIDRYGEEEVEEWIERNDEELWWRRNVEKNIIELEALRAAEQELSEPRWELRELEEQEEEELAEWDAHQEEKEERELEEKWMRECEWEDDEAQESEVEDWEREVWAIQEWVLREREKESGDEVW